MKRSGTLSPSALLLAAFCAGCLLATPGQGQAQGPADPAPASSGTALSAAKAGDDTESALIQPGELLTLARVVEITRKMQPEILAARAGVQAGESRVGLARAGYYPQVEGQAGYSRISPAAGSAPGVGNSTFDHYSAEIKASQMLYDFGRTQTRVEISRSGLDFSRAALTDMDEEMVFQATQAYYDLLKAMKNREVAAETVRQFTQHLEQAKGFFQAGLKPRYDVTRAEVDLSKAKLNLTRAENSLELARVVLNNAMGLPEAPPYQVKEDKGFKKFNLPLETTLLTAFRNRADLKALLLRKQAAQQELSLAGKGMHPSLAGTAGASYSGESSAMEEGWNVGVTLSFPIFNGQQTRHRVEEARAGLRQLAANESALRQAIHKEIRLGHLTLEEAAERVQASELIVRQAEENHEIATGRYRAGVGTPVELADADAILVDARTGHIQALYDYRIGVAAMERAMGLLGRTYPE